MVVIAPFFQRSPGAVFSLTETPVENLSQLANLRIAVVESDATMLEVKALFKTRDMILVSSILSTNQ